MDIKNLQKNWNAFGKMDALWAILQAPDKKGKKWDQEEFFKNGAREIDAVMQYIESLGVSLPRGRALDFGCGVGRLTQGLARYFAHVDGIDIAPSMIALAREYNQHGDKCSYHLNEATDLTLFPDKCFDFIYSNITLQHMEPRYTKQYIQEFIRLLTPQGLLLFQLPSTPCVAIPAPEKIERKIKRGIGKIIRAAVPATLLQSVHMEPISECYGIEQEELLNFLKSNGGKIVDITQDTCTPGWISFRYCVAKC
jgi:ubiquinone/menaquinone biosynthesis C-methylase UbiE